MLVRFALLASLALSACAAGPSTPTLKVFGDRLFIDAAVNGAPVEALLDSAAEISFADRAWAEKIGLESSSAEIAKGSGGAEDVAFAEGVTIETLGVSLEGLKVAVLDLNDLSTRLIGRPVRFIMGRELFDQERVSVDIESGMIAVVPRAMTPAGVALPLASERGIETFSVRVNGREAKAEFDLGNGSDILIGERFARSLGLLENPDALPRRKGGGVGGEIERKVVRLASLDIAGRTFHDVEAAVDDLENAGDLNIGVRYLRHFLITADFAQRTIWLAPR
ncbi:MAG: retropepsin-like aspartic protease [Parvularculaceae bacterium]